MKRQIEQLADRNVVLRLMSSMGATRPHELLDVVVAKILDNLCLGSYCPTSVVDASLRCLHELSLGVTLVVKSAGIFGSTQTPIEVGSDILKTISVQALLHRPSEIVFPCLTRLQKHARYRSMIYSTMTRLLFLNAKAVTRPEATLMKRRKKIKGTEIFGLDNTVSSDTTTDMSTSISTSASTTQSTSDKGLNLADSIARDARASRISAESKGPAYESVARKWREVEDLASTMTAASAYSKHLENEDEDDDPERTLYVFSPGVGGSNDRSSWFSLFVQPISTQVRKLYDCLKDPKSVQMTFGTDAILKLCLIGSLRDIRGVLSAANTSNEFKLAHDWLIQSGAPALLKFTSMQLPLEGNIDVIIPLLRVLIEYVTNRQSRIIFPPENAGGLVVVSFVASCTVALMRSALTAVSIQAQKGGAQGSDLQKILRLCLVSAHRILQGRICNFSVMAAFGDTCVLDLWPASIACIAALPSVALDHDVKASETVFEAAHALVTSPYPQTGLIKTIQCVSSMTVSALSPGLTESTVILHPEAVLAFLRISGRKLFLDVVNRIARGLQGQGTSKSGGRGGGRGSASNGRISQHALEFFESLLTLEAEARLLKQEISNLDPVSLNQIFSKKGLTEQTAIQAPSTPAAARRALFFKTFRYTNVTFGSF
jgi:hypothetical protein